MVYGGLDDLGASATWSSGGEIVYHLAAWLANTDMPDMTSIFVINSLVPAVLAKLCAKEQRRLVFTSSHSVYFAGPYAGRIARTAFRSAAIFSPGSRRSAASITA